MNSSYRFTVPAVPPDVPRPIWSVMIPTYNCAHYLRETLQSVLQQDPGADVMQIMVVDDCSTTDDPRSVVTELGQGRVEFYQQPQNVGLIKNFQTCLEKARGHLVHQLHGDDSVRPGFYQAMQRAFDHHPEIGAAFCRSILTNEAGHWLRLTDLDLPASGVLPVDWLEQLAIVCRILTPAMVVRRVVYEKLGGFDQRLRTTEDWEMWVRIAAHYPIWFEIEPLALYRQHQQSNSQSNVKNGIHAEQLYQAIIIFESYLSDRVPPHIFQRAKQNCAFFALETAKSLLKAKAYPQAWNLIRAALSYCRSTQVMRSMGRLLVESVISH